MTDRRLDVVLAAKDITGKAFASVSGRIARMAKSAISLQGAFAAVAGTAGIGLVVKQSLELNDRLAKTSDKLGITTEALAGLRHAAELTGVASNTLDMALQRMVRRVAEAAQGTGEARNAIAELGLDAEKLARISPDKQFAAIADRMAQVTNQADRVRLSFKLFDSEGVAVVNTLKLGSAGLRAAAQEADRLGIAINRVEARRIEEANDAMLRMNQALSGLSTTLTVAIAPTIADIANHTADWVAANNSLIKSGLPEYIDTATAVLGKYVEMLKLAYKWHPVNVARRLGKSAVDWINDPTDLPSAGIGAPGAYTPSRQPAGGFKPYRPDLSHLAVKGGGTTQDGAYPYIAENDPSWMHKLQNKGLWDETEDIAETTFDNISGYGFEAFSDIEMAAQGAASGMAYSFTDFLNVSSAGFLSFEQLGLDVFNNLYQAAQRMFATTLVSSLFPAQSAGGLLPFDASSSHKLLPRAAGGPVLPGGAYLVGERGPELFSPSSAGNITPNHQLGGGGDTYNININAVDAQSVGNLLKRNGGTILGIVNRDIRHNGATRATMRSRL